MGEICQPVIVKTLQIWYLTSNKKELKKILKTAKNTGKVCQFEKVGTMVVTPRPEENSLTSNLGMGTMEILPVTLRKLFVISKFRLFSRNDGRKCQGQLGDLTLHLILYFAAI